MIIHEAPPAAVRLVERAGEWDSFIASAPDGHLLQSFRWGELKAAYGWIPERLMVTAEGGAAAAQVLWRSTPLGTVAYLPRGPVVQPAGHAAATAALMEAVHRRARARQAVFLKVEPNCSEASDLPFLGFHQSSQTVQPKATIMVDLSQGLDAVSARQHSKTRYNIRLAAKKGVTIRRGGVADVPAFHALMAETGHRDGFGVRPAQYYKDALEVLGDQADLMLAEHDGDVLAGIIVGRFGGEAIYLYGASGTNKRNLMPTYLLQWEAMRRSCDLGQTQYDLWGIPSELAGAAATQADGDDELPEMQEHQKGDLWGVYRFKRGLGGRIVGYSGAYDYVYGASRYWLWQRAVPRVMSFLRKGKGMAD